MISGCSSQEGASCPSIIASKVALLLLLGVQGLLSSVGGMCTSRGRPGGRDSGREDAGMSWRGRDRRSWKEWALVCSSSSLHGFHSFTHVSV